jgi:hypothetical protein
MGIACAGAENTEAAINASPAATINTLRMVPLH